MALNIPLPNAPIGTFLGGLNAASQYGQNINRLRQSQAEAQYAPYTAYSNALSKMAYANMLPYQIQSTIMSNPLIWQAFKDKPEALNAMVNNLMSSIPQGNQVNGNINMPRPDQKNMGLMDLLINRLSGNGISPQESVSTITRNIPTTSINMEEKKPSIGSPLLPSTQGGMAGIMGQKTAPFITSPYKGGSLVDIGGEPTSIPTESTKTSAQSAINAAERVAPQLEKISDLAAPFLSLKGIAQNQIERVLNLIDPSGQKKLPGQYAEYRSILKAAPEALVKSYGLRPTNETIHRMEQIIEPYTGETKEQYKSRISRQLESIKNEQIGISKKQLSEGFPLSKESPGPINLSKGLELPEFETKEQFKNWYNRQPEYTKKAIRIKLGEK